MFIKSKNASIQLKPTEVQVGICDIADPRMAKLIKMYNPKKIAYAKLEEEINQLDENDRETFMK